VPPLPLGSACVLPPRPRGLPIKGRRSSLRHPALLPRRSRSATALREIEPASSAAAARSAVVSTDWSAAGANWCHHHVHLAELEPTSRFLSPEERRSATATWGRRRPTWPTAAGRSGRSRSSPPSLSTQYWSPRSPLPFSLGARAPSGLVAGAATPSDPPALLSSIVNQR
jgi:hypothetical protein